MNKKIRYLFTAGVFTLCLFLQVFFFSAGQVYAAELSFDVSEPREVGSQVKITIKASGGPFSSVDGGFEWNADVLEFVNVVAVDTGGGKFTSNGNTFTIIDGRVRESIAVITFNVLKAGNTSVRVRLADLADMDAKSLNTVLDKNVEIATVLASSKATNANLSSLSVSPGTLSPAFSANTTTYSVTVPDDQKEINLDYKTQDAKASVVTNSVHKNLKAGENSVRITVTAEDGKTKKIYTVNVTRGTSTTTMSSGTATATTNNTSNGLIINGKEYDFITAPDDLAVPPGFSKETIKYQNRDVSVWVKDVQEGFGKIGMTLAYLGSGEERGFYLFNPDSDTPISPYVVYDLPAKSYMISQAEGDLPAGFEAFIFKYKDKDITAYRRINGDADTYVLLYLQDEDNNGNFFLLDKVSEMIFPYSEGLSVEEMTLNQGLDTSSGSESSAADGSDVASASAIETTRGINSPGFMANLENPYAIATYLVAVFAVAMITALIVLLIRRRRAREFDDDDMDEWDEDEDMLPLDSYSNFDSSNIEDDYFHPYTDTDSISENNNSRYDLGDSMNSDYMNSSDELYSDELPLFSQDEYYEEDMDYSDTGSKKKPLSRFIPFLKGKNEKKRDGVRTPSFESDLLLLDPFEDLPETENISDIPTNNVAFAPEPVPETNVENVPKKVSESTAENIKESGLPVHPQIAVPAMQAEAPAVKEKAKKKASKKAQPKVETPGTSQPVEVNPPVISSPLDNPAVAAVPLESTAEEPVSESPTVVMPAIVASSVAKPSVVETPPAVVSEASAPSVVATPAVTPTPPSPPVVMSPAPASAAVAIPDTTPPTQGATPSVPVAVATPAPAATPSVPAPAAVATPAPIPSPPVVTPPVPPSAKTPPIQSSSSPKPAETISSSTKQTLSPDQDLFTYQQELMAFQQDLIESYGSSFSLSKPNTSEEKNNKKDEVDIISSFGYGMFDDDIE